MKKQMMASVMGLSVALAGCSNVNKEAASQQRGYLEAGMAGSTGMSCEHLKRASMFGGPLYLEESGPAMARSLKLITPEGPVSEQTSFRQMIEGGNGSLTGPGSGIRSSSRGMHVGNCTGDACHFAAVLFISIFSGSGEPEPIFNEEERNFFGGEIQKLIDNQADRLDQMRPLDDLNTSVRNRFSAWPGTGDTDWAGEFASAYSASEARQASGAYAGRVKKDREELAGLLESMGQSGLLPLVTGEGRRLEQPVLVLSYRYVGLLPFGKRKERQYRLGGYVDAVMLTPNLSQVDNSFPVRMQMVGFPWLSEAFSREAWFDQDGELFLNEVKAFNADIAARVEDHIIRRLPPEERHMGGKKPGRNATVSAREKDKQLKEGLPVRYLDAVNPPRLRHAIFNISIYKDRADHVNSACKVAETGDRNPVFEWKIIGSVISEPPLRVTGYDFRLYDQRYDLVEEAINVPGPKYALKAALEPRIVYLWSVRARMDQDGMERVTPWEGCTRYSTDRDLRPGTYFPVMLARP